MALRCARGEPAASRSAEGRRHVELSAARRAAVPVRPRRRDAQRRPRSPAPCAAPTGLRAANDALTRDGRPHRTGLRARARNGAWPLTRVASRARDAGGHTPHASRRPRRCGSPCWQSAAAAGAARPAPYGDNDFGGFRDMLPPGYQRARQRGSELLAVRGERRPGPRTTTTSCDMYADLVYGAPDLGERDLVEVLQGRHLRRAARGRREHYSPRDDVTIVRDKQFGIPHIYGVDAGGGGVRPRLRRRARTASSSSTSCATSAARELSSFAGGAPGNRDFDELAVGRSRPTTRPTSRQQFDLGADSLRRAGRAAPEGRPTTTSPASTSTSTRPSSTRSRCPASTRRSTSRWARRIRGRSPT